MALGYMLAFCAMRHRPGNSRRRCTTVAGLLKKDMRDTCSWWPGVSLGHGKFYHFAIYEMVQILSIKTPQRLTV